MNEIIPKTYTELLCEVKEIISTSQKNALKCVKTKMREADFFEEAMFEFLNFETENKTHFLSEISRILQKTNNNLIFVGRQFRLQIDDKEYFIDLLLYHRQLRCLVAIELKIGEFLPEYVGKMQFYLAVLNDEVRLEDENPTIGIILCKDKNKTVVEYALKQSNSPVGIAEYKLVSTLPEDLQKQLPAPEQIAEILDII